MSEPTRPEEKEIPVTPGQISVPEQTQEVVEAPAARVEQVSSTEVESTSEAAPDIAVEQVEQSKESVDLLPATDEPIATPAPAPLLVEKDRLEKEVEAILEEDLMDLYLKLPADQQAAFKAKGEETLGTIRQLLNTSKVNAKKIFSLIKEWLKMVPGVNKFFLTQEAKIKTDKILIVNNEENKRAQDEL